MVEMEAKKVDDVEQAVIDAYMDLDQNVKVGPSHEEQVAYLKARLNEVQRDYKILQLQKMELEKTNRQTELVNLQNMFKQNYLSRKYVVKELRKFGETVEDPFIMG
jgi:hypothetical protein